MPNVMFEWLLSSKPAFTARALLVWLSWHGLNIIYIILSNIHQINHNDPFAQTRPLPLPPPFWGLRPQTPVLPPPPAETAAVHMMTTLAHLPLIDDSTIYNKECSLPIEWDICCMTMLSSCCWGLGESVADCVLPYLNYNTRYDIALISKAEHWALPVNLLITQSP